MEYEMTPSCFADFRYDISAERGCEDCPRVVSCAGNTKIVNKALTKFVEQISRLSIWDYDDYQECEYPAEGYLDSHCCLMELVEAARKIIPYRSKELKPLSEEEIQTYRHMIDWTAEWSYIKFARAIEAAHGIKGEA